MGNGQSATRLTSKPNSVHSSNAKSKQRENNFNKKSSPSHVGVEPNLKVGSPIKHIIHEGSLATSKPFHISKLESVKPKQQPLKPFTYNRSRYQENAIQSKSSMPNLKQQFNNEKVELTTPAQTSSTSYRPDVIHHEPCVSSTPSNNLEPIQATSNYEEIKSWMTHGISSVKEEMNYIEEKRNSLHGSVPDTIPKQLEPKENTSSSDYENINRNRQNLARSDLFVEPEIHLSSVPNFRRQDLCTAQSTASSTARKLKIRGLKTFIEKHHGGTPPLWVKEFPCRSKFHPDQYIYDFEEGPFAPKRPAVAMNQCPKKGGRCTKCGIYTSDICTRCRMCEADCICKGVKKLSPNFFQQQTQGSNTLDFVGNMLNQAQYAFEGLKPEVHQPAASQSQLKWPEKQHDLSSELPRQYPFNCSIKKDQNRLSNGFREYSPHYSNSCYASPSSVPYPYPSYPPGYMMPPCYPYQPTPWGMYPPTPYPPMTYPYPSGNPYYTQPQSHQAMETRGTPVPPYNFNTKVTYNNSDPI